MRDRDVRESVWRWLESVHAGESDTLMLDELGILNGATRIDIAVINGQIEGFELKSEKDTLERLPAQRDLYNKVFNKVSLVVAEKHQAAANAIIPDWWGVMLARPLKSGAVKVSWKRQPKPNPCLDPVTVASLLWRDEALQILERYEAAVGVRSKPREALYKRLADVLDLDTLSSEVRTSLKIRENWRTGRESRQCGD
ncbi:sce7726 family protein [Alcaligenes faecalis]|uniref:sce7726 family protein n=1 Tax=Alcaligenes faecalis TaxID=511 RepID=UPI00211CFC58|nr:sce7726 family protein [Alcaligenes faecalis]UUO12723.1 sce7726 family protein [Alcaligenes faecalis]